MKVIAQCVLVLFDIDRWQCFLTDMGGFLCDSNQLELLCELGDTRQAAVTCWGKAVQVQGGLSHRVGVVLRCPCALATVCLDLALADRQAGVRKRVMWSSQPIALQSVGRGSTCTYRLYAMTRLLLRGWLWLHAASCGIKVTGNCDS
jgi:hypothetical protein